MFKIVVQCDNCNKLESATYMSDIAFSAILRQKGWYIGDKKCLCAICALKEKHLIK